MICGGGVRRGIGAKMESLMDYLLREVACTVMALQGRKGVTI